MSPENSANVFVPDSNRILLIGLDPETQLRCRTLADKRELDILEADDLDEGLNVLNIATVRLVVCAMHGRVLGRFGFLAIVRSNYLPVPVVCVADKTAGQEESAAIRHGAADYFAASLTPAQFEERLSLALDSIAPLPGVYANFHGIVGSSPRMQYIYWLIERCASSDARSALILGETGTGKELVARAIHGRSHRRALPFLAVDCGAIAPHLIESELFGHMKGSFTDAFDDKPGLLESAGEGTVFLDEIGEVPLDLQAKFLRAIQERTIRRIGGAASIPIRPGFIFATNKDLAACMANGTFRSDLFFRISAIQFNLPALRKRRTDIPALARHFLQAALGQRRVKKDIFPEAMQKLVNYDWPGNVRELENAVRHAAAIAEGPVIQTADFPSPISDRVYFRRSSRRLEDLQMATILRAIQSAENNVPRAAELLGMPVSTLYQKLREIRALRKQVANG